MTEEKTHFGMRWFKKLSPGVQRKIVVGLLLGGYIVPWAVAIIITSAQVSDVRQDTTLSTRESVCNNRYVIRVLIDVTSPEIPPESPIALNFREVRNSLDVSDCGPPSFDIQSIYERLGINP